MPGSQKASAPVSLGRRKEAAQFFHPLQKVGTPLGQRSTPVLATLSIHVSTGSDDGRLCRPLVIMMKPAEDRDRDDLSADLGDRPRSGDRYPLPQTLLGPSAIEVDLDVRLQNATQLSLAEYEHVVEALSAHRIKKAFADGVQIWGARRDLHNLDLSALGHGGEPLPELVIVVSDEVLRSVTVRRGLPELLGRPGVGRAADHIEMNDFPRAVDHEEEREDGAKEHVVELQDVAHPNVAAVVSDEERKERNRGQTPIALAIM